MKKVRVGLVGSGFSAVLHAEAYQKVYGLDVKIKAIASVEETVTAFAEKYGIKDIYKDYQEMLKDPEIEVIDICTPPHLHVPMVINALEAGKHVICEKPLTGYFGEKGAAERVGTDVPKSEMYRRILEELDQVRKIVEEKGRLFMYAENFIYASAVKKTVEFLGAKKSKILYIKGEESHSGSHAHHAAYWKYNGGGSFIRQGSHPLSAALYLKQKEAEFRNEQVKLKSVVGDMGVVQSCLKETEKKYIASRPVDVEDLANVILTFDDGTKANIVAGDMVLCGVRNIMEVFTNDGAYLNNIAPNSQLMAYHADERGLEDVYITEKVMNKSGWQPVFVDEEIARGYVGEIQDFMECVATGREPQSGFQLAYDTTRAIYAAYCSAEDGVRVDL
ncbi:MAG: Gfo/Idh/MocA family oxidoreductase [Clostridiales bacterium]|nr:Gfo/Idh/MocA family oxidoreductase [Clostridiales bacterium]